MFDRWVSPAFGLVSSLAVAALLICAHVGELRWNPAHLLDLMAIAASAGLLIGLLHAMWKGRLQTEIHRLITHVDALGSTDAAPAPLDCRMGFEELAGAIDCTFSSLRSQVEKLIRQRRELEVQLRLAEVERRHTEAILNSISDAVLVTDSFNEITLANNAAARLWQFEADEARRQPLERVVRDPLLVKLVKDTREGGDAAPRRHIEHHLLRQGRNAAFDVSVSCISRDHHEATTPVAPGVVTILRDITREKQIAEMKSDFVSNVSHELRTPLSSIKAYMEMLIDGEADDEQTRAEFYNIIQGETNRLQRLIDNILNISRIESGVVKVQREHISLPAVIHEVINVMQPQARAKQIELIDVPSPVFFQVFADKDMILQATLNLVGNAIKYTPNGGKVTIGMSVDKVRRTVNVSVKDSGLGIPKEDLPFLFDKFYRVSEHKKIAKGTGLGLNLVKHIIETVHGGKVSVTSEVGVGSTFVYSLPLADGVI